MDRAVLAGLVAQGMSQRQIAVEMNCSQVNVRYWLRKHGLRTIPKFKAPEEPRLAAEARKRSSIPAPPPRGHNDSNFVGAVSESTVLAALPQAGYPCYVPFGVGKADMIIETEAGLRTVQCTTARLDSDRNFLRFNTCSINRHGKRVGYKGLVDYFAVTSPDYPGVFLVPIDDAPSTDMYLRISAPRNGQNKGVRFADDYLLLA
jgi:hypothetical protein